MEQAKPGEPLRLGCWAGKALSPQSNKAIVSRGAWDVYRCRVHTLGQARFHSTCLGLGEGPRLSSLCISQVPKGRAQASSDSSLLHLKVRPNLLCFPHRSWRVRKRLKVSGSRGRKAYLDEALPPRDLWYCPGTFQRGFRSLLKGFQLNFAKRLPLEPFALQTLGASGSTPPLTQLI